MVVGRVYTLVLVGVSIMWLPILERIQGSQFWDYSQAIGSYLIPPIVSTFLLGIFWTRTTEQVIGLSFIILTHFIISKNADHCSGIEIIQGEFKFRVVVLTYVQPG